MEKHSFRPNKELMDEIVQTCLEKGISLDDVMEEITRICVEKGISLKKLVEICFRRVLEDSAE